MAVNCDLSVSYYNKNKYTKFFNKQNYYLKKKSISQRSLIICKLKSFNYY